MAAYPLTHARRHTPDLPGAVGRYDHGEAHAPTLDLGLLALRLTVGGLLMGHGAQKLFGTFGGPGLQGTAGWMESMGLAPGERWATLAGLSEFGGGLLTALGFLHPLGPLATEAAMAVAALTVHGGKPIWVTEGGAELPVTNMAAAAALALAGPGRYSVDAALDVQVPREVVGLAVLAIVVGTAKAQQEAKAAQAHASGDGVAEVQGPAAD